MRLLSLRFNWERLARRDPLFAVLTDLEKRFGGPNLEQFFRSGTEEIDRVLCHAHDLGIAVPRRRALDFGCGVGRLTQAMAQQFERADGVDISGAMLRLARRYAQRIANIRFHRNVASNLTIFSDGTFTFVYSTLVLQHIEPRFSKEYVHELLRVLAPDGLLVFQLPTHRPDRAPAEDSIRTPVGGPLRREAFNAHISVDMPKLGLQAGEPVTLRVTVENRSPILWPALADSRGRYRINVANHWLWGDGGIAQRDDGRTELPHDVPPGTTADVVLDVIPPRFDGDYILEVDLVQERVGWFAQAGSGTFRIACRVEGGLPAPDREPAVEMPPLDPVPPFRERHPRVFNVLRTTGLRDAYWTYRRGLDRVKARRDVLIRRLIHPIVLWWGGLSFDPKMEMHCVAQSEVIRLITEGGGRLVDIEDELMPGDYHSCRYWVVKG